eukprot:COSAG05_NODE_6_length_45604_cov_26.489660_3_plen_309_part_00
MDVSAPATLVAAAAAALGACAVCAVSSGTGGGGASSVQSRVALEGNVNCRSLGGYPGLGGRTVRVGRLYRSDTLRKLTEADISLLNSLGLKTQLNMEGAVGTSLGKAGESTGARAVQPAWREVPIDVDPVERSPDGLGPDFVVSSENLIGAAKSCTTTNSAQAIVDFLDPNGKIGGMPGYYRSLLYHGRPRLAHALRLMMNPSNHPAIFHCTRGVDRTGVLGFILLQLLGVATADCFADAKASDTPAVRAQTVKTVEQLIGKANMPAHEEKRLWSVASTSTRHPLHLSLSLSMCLCCVCQSPSSDYVS